MLAAVSWLCACFLKVFWGHKQQFWARRSPRPCYRYSLYYQWFCSSGLQCSDRRRRRAEEDRSSRVQSWGERGGRVSGGVHQQTSPPPPASLRRVCRSLYMTLHFPFSLSARFCFPERLPSMLRLMSLFFSRASSSWNSSFTLEFVLADVSMKAHFQAAAWASPSFVSSSRWAVSSLLLPTSMMGMDSTVPLMARTWRDRGRSQSGLYVCGGLNKF